MPINYTLILQLNSSLSDIGLMTEQVFNNYSDIVKESPYLCKHKIKSLQLFNFM